MHTNHATSSLPHIDYRLLFLASLLLSGLMIAMDPTINRDAIIYLRSADAYLQGGFLASQQVYGRPLLPIGMAITHQLTGLSLVSSGLLLVSLCYGLLCTAFVATVHTLGGDRRVQLIAAAIILFHPMINGNRSSIMRDIAYWALLLMSFRALLLYARDPSLRQQLCWFAYILLASAFRFEGLFFAVLSPMALLFTRDLPRRCWHCLRLLVPQLLTITVLLLAILASRESAELLFPAIEGYIDKFLNLPGYWSRLTTRTGEAMLQFTTRDDAPVAVLAGFAAVLLLNICRALTWPWLLVLIWGRQRHMLARFRPDDQVLLRAHLLIGLTYLSLFMVIKQFMLERYANQLILFLMLFLPFLLNRMWQAGEGRWQKPLVILLLAGMAVDSIHNGDGKKAFIRDATEWVREKTPPGTSIASNDKIIAYFSERDFDWDGTSRRDFKLQRIIAEPQLWRDKDFLVMYVRRRDTQLWEDFLQQHQLQEMKAFRAENGGRVSIVWLFPAMPTPSQ